MKRISCAASLVLVLAVAPLWAADSQWIPFSSDEITAAGIEMNTDGLVTVDFEVVVPGVLFDRVSVEQGDFTRLTVPGMGRVGDFGQPMLPALRRFVEIPQGAEAKVEVNVLDREFVDLARSGFPTALLPMQRPIPKCDSEEARAWTFSYDAKAYSGTTRHPAAAIEGPFTFRDHRVVKATVAPITYDGASGIVEVATRTRVRISFENADIEATMRLKARLGSNAFGSFLERSTLNFELGGRAAGWQYPDAAPVEFLIITPSAYVTDLQPFVDWKTSCGFRVTVATTDVTGTTTTDIKNYITGLYNGPNPPVYILMIGDSPGQLVTYTVSGGGYGGTDLPYVQMDTGLYPDMMIARWPIDDSTELINMRDKILKYEQPTAADSAWMNRALFMAGYDYVGRVTTHEDVIAELMEADPNYADCDLWYDSSNPTVADLIADLNTGRAWAVYSAHSGPGGWSGAPPLSSSDFANFTNTDRYPISHGHSCSSNEWNNYDDVFGEAAVVQPSKGFVSYWGGSASTYWDGDDWLERGFFDALVEADMPVNVGDWDGQFSNVAANYSGLTEVTLNGGDEDYYWHCYNLNGDPTLDPFTRAPAAINVGAPVAVTPSATDNFTVTVTDAGSGAVPGALVAASQSGVLLGAGYTDGTGTAVFHIDAPAAGTDLLVRVTGHNLLPTDAAVMVGAGADGIVTLDRNAYPCVATVEIDVFDENAGAPLTVELKTSISNTFTVDMIEVGDITGHFAGSAVLGTDLVVADADTLTAEYVDVDTGGGGSATKTADATIDCAGPVISDVITGTVDWDFADVSFTTDEVAAGTLSYGTSCDSLINTLDGNFTTTHGFHIGGLLPLSTYYYAVAATDGAGNYSSDDNGGDCYSFTTFDRTLFFTELFAGDNDLEGTMLSFTPDGSNNFYEVCTNEISELPVDPTGGTTVSLSDDGNLLISPAFTSVKLFGITYTSFYLGANGYVTFDSADGTYTETFADHFDQPRVSALFDDLNPSSGGTVSWKEMAGSVVITWEDVPEYSSSNFNTFQIELHANGNVVLSYVQVDATDGLAGLSPGGGVDPDFEELDLSAFPMCNPVIFMDGWESGDCSMWSEELP